MLKRLTAFAVLFVGLVHALSSLQTRANQSDGSAWTVSQFRNFVVFGDSYSDENRFLYFVEHNGSAPPTGTLLPEALHTAVGGRVWARYVLQYTEQNMTLYNYACDGAACSNQITPHWLDTMGGKYPEMEYPDLDGYEIPAFFADKAQDVNIATGAPYFTPALTEDNTVYAIWDGVNDLSINAFFTDSQVTGYVLSDYVDCLFTQMDRLYASGGRYFVLFNIIPIELTALFANASEGGETPSYYWPTKPENLTDISEKMTEWTTTLNSLFKYKTPVEVLLNDRYPNAKVALFDVNRLVSYKHIWT